MTGSLSLGCAMALLFGTAGACSSREPADGPSSTPTAGVAGSSTSTAGTSAAVDTPSGGSSAGQGGGVSTNAGTSPLSTGGGGQATGGSDGASAGGNMGGPLPEGPFGCTMYMGAYLTMEWWNTGQFEGKAGDATKVNGDNWELKWHHHAHVSEWRKADSPFWSNEGNPMDDSQGAPIQSPCTTNPDKPDRVVFLAIDWELLTEDDWIAGLNACATNIKTKIPSAKRVDIVTLVRCPDNMMCNPTADYGPGANDSAPRQDCYVPDYVDSAIAKVIAAQPAFLTAGPKLEMAMCNPSHDGAHMTGEGNQQAAKDYAAYYLQHL
jgi:hypothetical protein